VDNNAVTNSKVVDDALGVGREVDCGEVGDDIVLEKEIVDKIEGILVDGNSVVRLALVDVAVNELVVSNGVLRKRTVVVAGLGLVLLITVGPVLGERTLVLLDGLHGDKTKVVVGVEVHVVVDLNDIGKRHWRHRSVTILHNTSDARGNGSHTEVSSVARGIIESVGSERLVLSGDASDVAPVGRRIGSNVEGNVSHGDVLVIVLDNTKKRNTKDPLHNFRISAKESTYKLSGSKVVLARIVDASNSRRNNREIIREHDRAIDDAANDHVVGVGVLALEIRSGEKGLSRISLRAEDDLLVNGNTVGEPLGLGEVETALGEVTDGGNIAGNSREDNKSNKENRTHDQTIRKRTGKLQKQQKETM